MTTAISQALMTASTLAYSLAHDIRMSDETAALCLDLSGMFRLARTSFNAFADCDDLDAGPIFRTRIGKAGAMATEIARLIDAGACAEQKDVVAALQVCLGLNQAVTAAVRAYGREIDTKGARVA